MGISCRADTANSPNLRQASNVCCNIIYTSQLKERFLKIADRIPFT